MDLKKDWNYLGSLPSSKSIFNRALILQSFEPGLKIAGSSEAEDVSLLKKALENFTTSPQVNELPIEFFCGEGGTTFRFLALRVSRRPGKYFLRARPRLLERPQDDLLKLLRQLRVEAQFHSDGLLISSEGWSPQGDGLYLDQNLSSQFISALFLSSIDLPMPLFLFLGRARASQSYLTLTRRLMARLGVKVLKTEEGFHIPARQKIEPQKIEIEADLSSGFSLAAMAALGGSLVWTKFPTESLQPDFQFLELFKKMGIPWTLKDQTLRVGPALSIDPIEVDLSETPDLLPCLGLLCAFAQGPSRLRGLRNCRLKESDRVKKTAELLSLMGVSVEERESELKIHGCGIFFRPDPQRSFEFDPDQDHRMAFAAGLLLKLGFPIRILEGEVVKKSFPEFWDILGVRP